LRKFVDTRFAQDSSDELEAFTFWEWLAAPVKGRPQSAKLAHEEASVALTDALLPEQHGRPQVQQDQ
jgi:hypothetical protein